MEVSVQTVRADSGPTMVPSLTRAHFNSASTVRGSVRDNSLDVITEEKEVLITQVPESPYSAPPRLRQVNGNGDLPPDGVFVSVDDVEQFILDYDAKLPKSAPGAALRRAQHIISPPVPPIVPHVSSDDEDYETDLEYDEEVWLNPDKRNEHDITGRAKYVKVCSDLGVTPVTSYLENLSEREINLKFYGLGVASAKALSVPLETNTVTEKLNLEGNGLEREGARFLCRILKENLYITELVLSENQIGNDGAKAVCDLLMSNRCITKLDLSGNQIDDSCAHLFGNVLANNMCLKHLKLAHNRFEEIGAKHFKGALSDNESLELFDLSWNHFGCKGAAMLAEGLQENVGLKYFFMPMAGLGSAGSVLIRDVLANNRTVLELDIRYCRIPVGGAPHIARGLLENDVLQVLKVGSNPFDADSAMELLKAVDGNDACAIRHLDLSNIFVKTEFVELAHKLQEQRGVTVQYEGVLPSAPKHQRSVAEMVRFRTDPIGHLRQALQQGSMAPSEVFHLNGPAKITRQEFTDTIRMAQLDLTAEQINILFGKVNINGLIDIEAIMLALLCLLVAASTVDGYINLTSLSYVRLEDDNGGFTLGASTYNRIAFDPTQGILYSLATEPGRLTVFSLNLDGTLTQRAVHAFATSTEGHPLDVEFCSSADPGTNDRLAISFRDPNSPSAEGDVHFYQPLTAGNYDLSIPITTTTVGAEPLDMEFTPDCLNLLVANKGKPSLLSGGTVRDPEGIISKLVLAAQHVPGSTITTTAISFSAVNDQANLNELLAKNFRPWPLRTNDGPIADITPSKNMEPVNLIAAPNNNVVYAALPRFPIYSTYQPRQIKWVVQDEAQWMITLDSGYIDEIPEYSNYRGAIQGKVLASSDGSVAPELDVSAELIGMLDDNTKLGEAEISIEDGKGADGTKLENLFLNGGRGISIRRGSDLSIATSLIDNVERETAQNFRTIFNSGMTDPSKTPQQERDVTSPSFGPDLSVIETGIYENQKVLFLGGGSSGIIYVYVLVPDTDCPQPYFHSAKRFGNTFLTWQAAYNQGQVGDIGITDMLYIPRQGQRTVDVLAVASATSNSIHTYLVSEV
ncbi:hypothetical protein BaRGS_00006051 [Batillaria attramentaria]|uniref:Uncharacterized protein n=1 Tax=Batillaria attramentaria TaxID=370345 RepID=A0ABD0LUP0_9CAEN